MSEYLNRTGSAIVIDQQAPHAGVKPGLAELPLKFLLIRDGVARKPCGPSLPGL
jgi:hypothetical protein